MKCINSMLCLEKIMSGLWEEYEKEKQTTRKNKKKTRLTRLGGGKGRYIHREGSGRNAMTQHRPESDQQTGCAADTHRALSDWKPTRRKYIRSGQFLLKSIDLLRIVFMRNSLKSMRRLWKRQEKGNEKKTMIETRRGREREAEEEADVRKQGGI